MLLFAKFKAVRWVAPRARCTYHARRKLVREIFDLWLVT